MPVTLASNMDFTPEIGRLFLMLLPFAAMFAGAFVGAFVLAGAGWRGRYIAVLAWAACFPLFQSVFAIVLVIATNSVGSIWLSVLVPTGVTAAALWVSTRSMLPVLGCATAAGAFVLQSVWTGLAPEGPYWVPVVAGVWVAIVGASLTAWGWRERSRRPLAGHCAACGYDLRGLVTRVCPECGGKRPVIVWKPTR